MMKFKQSILVIFIVFFFIVGLPIHADDSFRVETVPVNSWQLSAAIGYGEISSPIITDDDIHLLVLPDIRYYGDYLYIENTTVGWNLKETPRYAFGLVSMLNMDGLYFSPKYRSLAAALSPPLTISAHPDPETDVSDSDDEKKDSNAILVEQEQTKLTYNAGFAWRYYGPIELRVALLKDVSVGHNGEELHALAKTNYQWQQLALEFEMGATFKSSELVDYYYGIESTDTEQVGYAPKSSINVHSQLQLAYPLSAQAWLVAAFRYEYLGAEIRHSPIVHDVAVRSYFLGVKWRFK
ncbi:outer membrane protein [Pseudoalteromonas sp. MBR-15]|jgi:outer membrane protein|uniref:MipA/OmpV family protein n=1 Tax=Pseudoalteromonas lipolytica TaxID=570156 RepID=UPI003BA3191F